MVFTEDESYLLCRYEEKDRKLYDKIWEETFGQSPVLNDTELKIKLWQDVLFDKNKLQLKIIHKKTGNYVGEVMVMNLDSEMPELGIQILKEYQGKGIGSRIMKNFIDQLKSILPVEAFLLKFHLIITLAGNCLKIWERFKLEKREKNMVNYSKKQWRTWERKSLKNQLQVTWESFNDILFVIK